MCAWEGVVLHGCVVDPSSDWNKEHVEPVEADGKENTEKAKSSFYFSCD